MPTYQYRCNRCEQQFDLWQSFSDDTLTACPKTGGPSQCVAPGEGEVRKVFASVGITFKGDGFYKNDYGANSSGRKKEAATTSNSNGSSSGTDSSSSDKSASKSESTSKSTADSSSSGSSSGSSSSSSSSKSSSSSSD